MTRVTPLLRFLRALDADQRAAFSEAVGTTTVYLYQLAGQPAPNPRLRLAIRIVEASEKFGPKWMTPPLTYHDLLIGTEDDPYRAAVAAAGPD